MSLSETRTVPRKHKANKVVQRQRAYDHLYDPVYTVSSEVDHARANLRAHASKDRIRQVPVFESMFSTLPHHPSYTLQLDASDPVPPTIERRWQGHAEQRKAALQQLAGVIPNDKLRLQREDCHVTGADRWKFFKRPLIPYLQQAPSNIIFTLPTDDFEPICGRKAEQGPTHFTVGVQTDYRESETQTDPYSPDYVVQPGTTPSELLQMATLLWGRGLPAGQAEVEMIQRARARLAWEATLPPMDDLSQLDKRRRMMEEMDAKEWAFREGEIKKLQEARLAVLKDLVKQRDENQNKVTSERIDQIHSRLLKNKDTRLNKINNDYLRSLRKLETRRRNLRERQDGCVTLKKSSSSQMNAFHTSRDTSKKEFKSHYLDTYEGLQKLEAGLAASTLKPQVIKPKPREKLRKDVVKPPVSREEQLMLKYKALKEEEEQAQKPLRVLVKKEKPVPRPPTPKVEEPPEGDENTELGVIQLQKLLRGRSVQYQMFSGKENHLNLIQELRTVHALQAEEQRLQKADKEMLLTQKKQRDQLRKKRSQELAFQASAVGAELEHLFSTLSKDLIHLQEERRIHAFTLMAERDRRLREAEESGRRQVEERRRREEDEIFRQVVEVHQETLDLYLEDIILQTLEQTADQQARGEIHRKAKEVNDIAYAMEESGINSLQSEEIVSELVHSFLIPEIEKINVRQRVHQRQLRHLKAARSIIQGTAEHSGFLPSIQGASAVTCLSEKAANQVFEETIHQEEQEQRKDGK